jgi:hypothetical protein
LQQDVRPPLHHGIHEGIDEIIVLLTANAMVSPSDVNRALQSFLVVRSYIKQDGEAVFRMNAAECGVEGHLSDGDSHTSYALVAEAEDSLAVADDDDFVVARMAQDLFDAVFVRIAEKDAARLSPYLAEALTAFAYSWRIDERQHLFDIADEQCVEQRFV